ncbi:MAG: hypothetical protein ACI9YB_000857 [Halioglobus sp.]|jgi:hypothetical protein
MLSTLKSLISPHARHPTRADELHLISDNYPLEVTGIETIPGKMTIVPRPLVQFWAIGLLKLLSLSSRSKFRLTKVSKVTLHDVRVCNYSCEGILKEVTNIPRMRPVLCSLVETSTPPIT